MTGLISDIAIPRIKRTQLARDRITALVVELRYNQMVLRRFKESGRGVLVASSSAFDAFRTDHLLVELFASDSNHSSFDKINNAYAFLQSRATRNAFNEWEAVAIRFNAADTAARSFLRSRTAVRREIFPIYNAAAIRSLAGHLAVTDEEDL